jgi:ketosteroid isomerase-like protein
MPTNAELARQLFDAFERGDADAVRRIVAPTAAISQNGGPVMDIAALLQFAASIRAVVPDQRYENIVTRETSDGFVEEHDFAGTLADGTAIRLPACGVTTIADGRITSLREYLDTRAATKLFAALQG